MKCQASLNQIRPQRAVSDYENLVSLINQNMNLWGIRVVGMFGVEAWRFPQSPFLVCLISKRELKLQMGSKSLGLRSC